MQCSQDTVEKLQSNQGSILPRLQAVETLMREQNLAHKNKESLIATVQPVSPPSHLMKTYQTDDKGNIVTLKPEHLSHPLPSSFWPWENPPLHS